MNKFDKIIGYSAEKKELLSAADMQRIKSDCKNVPVAL